MIINLNIANVESLNWTKSKFENFKSLKYIYFSMQKSWKCLSRKSSHKTVRFYTIIWLVIGINPKRFEVVSRFINLVIFGFMSRNK